MKTDDSWYMEWAMTDDHAEEKKLLDRMEDLGELFEDMLFRPDTSPYELIKCQSKPSGCDEWIDDEVPLPPEIEYFTYLWFHPQVEELDNCGGYFDEQGKVICLPPKSILP